MARSPQAPKGKPSRQVDSLRHEEATRRNIPTAEMESLFRREEDASPLPPAHYPRARPLAEGARRTAEEPSQPELIWNGARITISDAQMRELAETGRLTLSDAQLVWRGKDRQDWSDLVVNVPPLYIQEKIHPKAIIDDLKRRTEQKREARADIPDLFADFNGIAPDQRAEFYQHDQHWSNRMILGDSLQVMASLAERESLRGKVQCIYFDPPYGIKFNSNWQVSTLSRDVKDGKQTDISREPEQVKAFRDTWKDGIHSYLTYLRDRLTVMRDLLNESGSIFVQIGDENVHRVRVVMDEVFGESNLLSQITFKKTGFQAAAELPNNFDYILWYGRDRIRTKFRRPYIDKLESSAFAGQDVWFDDRSGTRRRLKADERGNLASFDPDNIFRHKPPESAGAANRVEELSLNGRTLRPKEGKHYSTHSVGMDRLKKADRLLLMGNILRYIEYLSGFSVTPQTNMWIDTVVSGFGDPQIYVVQTSRRRGQSG